MFRYNPPQKPVGQASSGIDHGVSNTVDAERALAQLGNSAVPPLKQFSEAVDEKYYGSTGEILNEAGDNTRNPNVDQTFNHNSPTLWNPSTAFHSLNSQPDQFSLQQEHNTEQEIRSKKDFDTGEIAQEDIYNVLLLGETGVGKTTFINSCANYIKFNSMDDALAGGPEILMDSTFTASKVECSVK